MWQKSSSPNYTQAAALTFCAALGLAGYADWRLPTVIELLSIVDFGTHGPSIDGTAFPATDPHGYWASTAYPGGPSSAWAVNFGSGNTSGFDVSGTFSERCVR
jgi:hypothetical protein